MTRATASAPANLAFVKYWGKLNPSLNLPLNGSISMNLSEAITTTTVEFNAALSADEILVGQAEAEPAFAARVTQHLDRIRALAGVRTHAYVQTENSFPAATGFASSASGMAALTLAGTAALGLRLDTRALSVLARLGSGSACRSIPDGFVEWVAADTHEKSYAHQIAAPDHWAILDIAVIVSDEAKTISSSRGHQLALQSPFWQGRQELLPHRLEHTRAAIKARDFTTFGQQLETEAIGLHAIAMTSPHQADGAWQSGIYYWQPDTVALVRAVQAWRADGIPVYYTLDAGPTVHLICPAEAQADVVAAVRALERQQQPRQPWRLLINRPVRGAHLVT